MQHFTFSFFFFFHYTWHVKLHEHCEQMFSFKVYGCLCEIQLFLSQTVTTFHFHLETNVLIQNTCLQN